LESLLRSGLGRKLRADGRKVLAEGPVAVAEQVVEDGRLAGEVGVERRRLHPDACGDLPERERIET